VIDVWSRKVVAWDVHEREDPAIAADLVSGAYLRERISKGRKQPLILQTDNGNAMRAAKLENRLEELGGRTGCAQVFLQATGLKRQPVLRIPVPDSEVPA
jgi:transposase InsO family protein